MKILTAHINGYGKFVAKTFNFKQGMNVIVGYNETGKSTLMSFIKSMLYGHKKNEREGKDGNLPEFKKYKPWHTEKYSGYLIVETDDGQILRIERDFNDKSMAVYNENNEDITSEFSFSKESGMLGQDLLGMDLECFINSSYICQDKSILYLEDKEHIAQKLMNISESAEQDVSVANAIKILKDGITELGTERTSKRRYNLLKEQLLNEQKELSNMKEKNEECLDYLLEARTLEKNLKSLEQEEKLCGKKQIYESAVKSIKEYEKYSEESKVLESKLSGIDISSFEKRKKQLKEDLSGHQDMDLDEQGVLNKEKTNRSAIMLTLIIGILALVSSIALAIFINVWFSLLVLITVVCAVLLSIFKKKNEEFETYRENIRALMDRKKMTEDMEANIRNDASVKDLIQHYEGLLSGILEEQDVLDFKALEEKRILYSPSGACSFRSREECMSQIQVKRERLAVVNDQIGKYSKSDDQIATQQEKIAIIEEQIVALLDKQKAMDLAILGINEVSKQIKEDIIPKMNEKMSNYLLSITANKHDNLLTGSKMNLNTEHADMIRSVYSFSDGTLRQMYLAFRLAAASVFSVKFTTPIFMDEALVYYDKERKKSTFDFLYDLCRTMQIIYFATDIENELLQDKNINIIKLD